MNILALATDIPSTPDMPGSPRMFYLCRELSRQHPIHLATLCSSPDRLARFRLHPGTDRIFSDIAVLPSPPPVSWAGKQSHRLHLASHLCTRYSHPAYHADLCARVSTLIDSLSPPRLVYIDRLSMTQYLRRDSRTFALVDLHDSLSLLFSQQAAREKRIRARLTLRLEQWALSRWERSLGSIFDLIILNSPVDETFLKSLEPNLPTLMISNGVDTSYFQFGRTPAKPRRLVFTGVMNYGPNEDAVRYFCSAVLPVIRTSFPDTEFWAVGANPSALLLTHSGNSGITITGTVEDIRPYLRQGSVFVCPLRYGTGIKNKLLSAMAVGLPIVCTSVAICGIDVRPEEHVLIADAPLDFARQVCRLLNDADFAARLARNAYEQVLERYSWATHGQRLEGAIRSVAGLPRGREACFV